MADGVIVKSKVKDVAGDCNVASDFIGALDAKVAGLIKEACERAKANNRRTVMAKDL
ncbi:DUF1931 domain-containing protein [Candidatus Woesearchaeota archaeon CG11_big_fil_rev_8_21_14_0_20_57_5]|nr:MAG: DUF1931 domain-containing protein [Candidatus Woesearchaeota archaeon CG11_big_fil_rev_8_21_14_0_20_57_5]